MSTNLVRMMGLLGFAGLSIIACVGSENVNDSGSQAVEPYVQNEMRTGVLIQGIEGKVETSCSDLSQDAKPEKCLQAEAEERASRSFLEKQSASVTYNVGIMDTGAPGTCPSGSTHIWIKMDDENSSNATQQSGFTDGWIEDGSHNTTMNFCKLNTTESMKFASIDGGGSTVGYMVLKLGTNCPNNGHTVKRYFDNEDNLPNVNDSSSGIAPNFSDDNTHLYFCYYPPYAFDNNMSPTISGMPSITNFPKYGVITKNAGAYFGWYYTDDEDNNNANYMQYGSLSGQALTQAKEIIEHSRNTKIHMSRVPN